MMCSTGSCRLTGAGGGGETHQERWGDPCPPTRPTSGPAWGRVALGTHYDPEAFGRFSEAIARYFGTARFLAIQTVLVAVWIALNSIGFVSHWDPYPFILLNLLFSTQAAYAAPLILLAQNRQDERDRENIERDREVEPAPRPTLSSWHASWPQSAWPSPAWRPLTSANDSLRRMEEMLRALRADVRPAANPTTAS